MLPPRHFIDLRKNYLKGIVLGNATRRIKRIKGARVKFTSIFFVKNIDKKYMFYNK